MKRLILQITVSFLCLCAFLMDAQGQGPPINTDTPIMLGLQGRGVHFFVKVVRKATLLQEGNETSDTMDRRITARITPLAIPYNLFNARFQIGTIIPFMDIDFDSRSHHAASAGIGDVRFFAKYLLYQRDRKRETLRIAAKTAVKLPSGDENKSPALGNGSTDYAFSTVAGWIKNRTGLYLEGIYNLNTSKGPIDFGDSFSYNLAIGYRLLPGVYETYPALQLNGFLEINGITMSTNQSNGRSVENSGGTTVFFSPGLQFVGGRRWLLEASFQYPIINKPNGTQVATDWTISLGTRVLLF
ncbi:MAG: transporter [Calditrichaeota bacterium]|nr:MAG: transporter [Calditrichota bacterium]